MAQFKLKPRLPWKSFIKDPEEVDDIEVNFEDENQSTTSTSATKPNPPLRKPTPVPRQQKRIQLPAANLSSIITSQADQEEEEDRESQWS